MAVHRYWRIVGIRTAGGVGALELSEARLYDASGVADGGAALSSTFAPAAGALSDLQDGGAVGVVSWPNAAWSAPGFALTWDFGGTTKDITGVRLGSGASASTFPLDLTLMWSDNAVDWTQSSSVSNILYPGANALTAVPSAGGLMPVDVAKKRAWQPAAPIFSITSPVVPPAGPPYAASSVARAESTRDTIYGGTGRVYGTVKEKNTPANTPLHRRVVLFDERAQYAVRETWSDPVTGNFEFTYLRMDVAFTVLAYDHQHNYRAVVADNQFAEAM